MTICIDWVAPWLRWVPLHRWCFSRVSYGVRILGLSVTFPPSIAYGFTVSVGVFF